MVNDRQPLLISISPTLGWVVVSGSQSPVHHQSPQHKPRKNIASMAGLTECVRSLMFVVVQAYYSEFFSFKKRETVGFIFY